MAEEYQPKKKKPIWVRILKWLLGVILSIALTLGGFCLYLYFKHQINVIDVINQVKVLNQAVNVDALATNQYSEEDLTNANIKIDNISTAENAIRLSDKELAAYLNDTIQTQEGGLPMTVGSSTINLVDYGFAIVQMQFSNIPEDSNSDKLTDFNIILKIELKKLKEEKMAKFPLKWVAKAVPNSLYFDCNVEINKTETGYETVSKYMTINNLSVNQTNSIFKSFDTFLKIGTADNFNKSLCDGFVKTIIGQGGLYDQLKTQGAATGYSFASDGTNNNLVIYTADVEEHHSITYHDNSETDIEYYTITDNTFAPKAAEKVGYTFDGWYDGEGEDANQITSIDATLMQDLELYARWSIVNYTISYNLDEGVVDGTNPTTYNVETDTFTLINPTKPHYGFLGWTWEGQTTPSNIATITKGTTGNLHFVANFDANSYSINYKDKNDEAFSGVFAGAYPTIHKFNQTTTLTTPTKEGYTFNGWFVEMDCEGDPITQIDANIESDTTLFAKWTINQYTLTLKDGATVLFTTTQNYGTAIPAQDDPVKTGYTFTGWSETIPTIMPAENKIILASFQANQYLLSFDANDGNCDVEAITITYNHAYGLLPTATRSGYNFDGWFVGSPAEQISTETVCRTTENITVYAHWTIIHYTINYTLNGGEVDGSNPESYTIEDEDITLINPTKEGYEFLGWEETSGDTPITTLIIPHGSTGNKAYNAIFQGYQKTLNITVDGTDLDPVTFEYGTTINTGCLIDSEEIGMSGYSVEKWYLDSEMTEEFDDTQNYYTDLHIYGSWQYIVNELSFYPYLTTFQAYKDQTEGSDIYTANNRDELMIYMDYVRFYSVTKKVKIHITYVDNTVTAVKDEILNAHNQLCTQSGFQTLSSFSRGAPQANSQVYGNYYVSTDNTAKQASKIMENISDYVYTQKDYALKTNQVQTVRTFGVDNITKTLTVTNTEQLIWALENGYKPNCIEGSQASSTYAKARTLLSQICSDSMTNYQKIKAIYEWLIMNVQYDNLGAYKLTNSLITAAEAKEYTSWSPEGVFDSKIAVCEGIAKAFVVMARIENIPAVMVVNSSHAWNKVYLNGKWYGIDATHGNALDSNAIDVDKIGNVKGIEVLMYNQFLFTDSYKSSLGYTATNFADFASNTAYDYYSNAQYSYNTNNFDLHIDTQEEMQLLLNYVKSVQTNMTTKQYTFEFSVDSSMSNQDIINWLAPAAINAGVEISTYLNDHNEENIWGYIKTDTSGNKVCIFGVDNAA